MSEQLTLDLEAACARLLAGRLADCKRTPIGAARLLAALVTRGMDERALMPAAALVIALDDASGEETE